MTTRVVALTFHEVLGADPHETTPGDRFYRIPVEEFEHLLVSLRRLRYQTVSSREFRAWQQGSAMLPERAVILTFDDGYASHFEQVVPLLLRYRFTGTFFINPARVGRPGYLTWDQLRRLVFLGMEIGSHGMTHQPLTQLSHEALVEELNASKSLVEERLGIPVRALAVPGGFWNRRVAHVARQVGYDAVWVSLIGTNGRETNPQAMRRIIIHQPVSVDRIVAMVEGWQPAFWWVAHQQFAIRTLKRVLGVYWYEQLKSRLVPNA